MNRIVIRSIRVTTLIIRTAIRRQRRTIRRKACEDEKEETE